MEHEFPFGIFHPGKVDYLFRSGSVAAGKFFAGVTKYVGFYLLSNWIFRKLFVNGKAPKPHKLAVFPGLAITSSVIPPSNNSQILKSHLLLLFRRVLFSSAFFSCLCCSSSLTAVFLLILFMSATRTMYESKSLPKRFMVKLHSHQLEPKTLWQIQRSGQNQHKGTMHASHFF